MSTPNIFQVTAKVAAKAYPVLENEIVVATKIDNSYESMFGNENDQNGATIQFQLPTRSSVVQGLNINTQAIIQTPVALTVQQWNVGNVYNGFDATLNMNTPKLLRWIESEMSQFASTIDQQALLLSLQVYNAVGTPGTAVTSLDPFTAASARLDFWTAPTMKRYCFISPETKQGILNSSRTFFNPVSTISEYYKKGIVSMDLYGFDVYMTQNIAALQHGVWGGTPIVAATLTNNGVTTVTASGFNAGDVLVKGAVFSINGVNAVNPQNRSYSSFGMQMVTTANCVADGAGNMTINFAPALFGPNPDGSPSQLQNVTALPIANAAIAPFAASGVLERINLAMQELAFTRAFVKLRPLAFAKTQYYKDPKTGISISTSMTSDINNYTDIMRFDGLFGFAVAYAQYACRISC